MLLTGKGAGKIRSDSFCNGVFERKCIVGGNVEGLRPQRLGIPDPQKTNGNPNAVVGRLDAPVENGFDTKYNCTLVHLKGQPARSTRRLIKRLNEECNQPVVVFTDGDPWSFRIFASVAYGAIKTAHISEYLATPTAQFLGVTPSDIINYDLPTDKLTDQDVDALKAELDDPRFDDDYWRGEINLQLEMKTKSEQQALAKYGLDFVTDTYLPEKLQAMGILK